MSKLKSRWVRVNKSEFEEELEEMEESGNVIRIYDANSVDQKLEELRKRIVNRVEQNDTHPIVPWAKQNIMYLTLPIWKILEEIEKLFGKKVKGDPLIGMIPQPNGVSTIRSQGKPNSCMGNQPDPKPRKKEEKT